MRPMINADLPLLTGGDSEFDDFGSPRVRTEPLGSDPAQAGGFTLVGPDGAVLGNVSWVWVHWGPNVESRNPMIGIWLAPAARGHGVGWRSQRDLVDHLFRATTTNRVEAHTDVENIGEQKALEKAGFSREGVVRGGQWRRGEYHDGHLYSVLRREWEAWKPLTDPT